MRKFILFLVTLTCAVAAQAEVSDNTVEVSFSGNTAEVNVAKNIADLISVSSGTSSHVIITSTSESVEILYALSGSSDDGSFNLIGNYKCGIDLNGLTLTNPSGPALNIQNGKRIEISAKKGTTNTLTDGKNKDYSGCIHCTGHLEFKGKGTLNVVGNSKHGIYCKEYAQIKNLTLNITGAVKDGIHCQEYFLMESGTVTISNTGDDGIQCDMTGEQSTGEIEDHDGEDTGNVYQLDGTLTIENYGGKAIKAGDAIYYRGGTQNFNTSDTTFTTGISTVWHPYIVDSNAIYDLNGRRVSVPSKGIYIQNGRKYFKH